MHLRLWTNQPVRATPRLQEGCPGQAGETGRVGPGWLTRRHPPQPAAAPSCNPAKQSPAASQHKRQGAARGAELPPLAPGRSAAAPGGPLARAPARHPFLLLNPVVSCSSWIRDPLRPALLTACGSRSAPATQKVTPTSGGFLTLHPGLGPACHLHMRAGAQMVPGAGLGRPRGHPGPWRVIYKWKRRHEFGHLQGQAARPRGATGNLPWALAGRPRGCPQIAPRDLPQPRLAALHLPRPAAFLQPRQLPAGPARAKLRVRTHDSFLCPARVPRPQDAPPPPPPAAEPAPTLTQTALPSQSVHPQSPRAPDLHSPPTP